MPFHFSLQAVLRCRQSFERRERQRLQVITREVVRAKQQSDKAKLDRVNALKHLRKKLHEGVRAVEMQFELACDQVHVRRITAWKEQVTKLEDLRRRQLESFRHAQQQREIMENLRDRQLAAYRLVQDRRAQQQLDDRFLITTAGQSSGS